MSQVLFTQVFPPIMYEGIQALLGSDIKVGMVANSDLTEFAQHAQDAEVLLNSSRPVNEELLRLAPRVGFVQQLSVGYEALDLPLLAQKKIFAANTLGSNADAVAEHTLLLMLSLLKQFMQAEQSARANKWEMMKFMQAGFGDLATATVGLIGMGAIGRAVAQRLRGFGAQVLYTSRRRLPAEQENLLGIRHVLLPDLLAESTIVSLHLPLSEQTYHLIGADQLALMRPGAILINTSRGGLIDEQALLLALQQQRIAGAGLDVLEHESNGGNIFTELPQVIVTPHVGGVSLDAIKHIMAITAANVTRFLQGKQPEYLLY